MKISFKYFLLVLISASILTSCAPDDDLQIDDRDKFIDAWTCNDSSNVFGSSAYTVTVERKGDIDSVRMKNFYNLGSSNFVYGLVSGSSITIPSQISDGITINGTGIFSNNSFNINYTAKDGSVTDVGKAVYTK
jgi:hypothetical protein